MRIEAEKTTRKKTETEKEDKGMEGNKEEKTYNGTETISLVGWGWSLGVVAGVVLSAVIAAVTGNVAAKIVKAKQPAVHA